MSTVETVAETNSKRQQQKDQQILATLKAVQADLAAVHSEVTTLRDFANNRQLNRLQDHAEHEMWTQMGGSSEDVVYLCKERKVADQCSHCYFCGIANQIARHCQT